MKILDKYRYTYLLGNIMADINLDELLRQFDDLSGTLTRMNSTLGDSTRNLGSLSTGVAGAARAVREETEARDQATKKTVAALNSAFGQLTSTLRGLTEGNSGFSALSSAMGFTVTAAGSLTGSLAKMGSQIPIIGGIFTAAGEAIEKTSKIIAEVGKVVIDQFDVGFKAFKDAARTGAINTFSELRDSSDKLKMRQEDLSSVLSTNSENLAQLGGSALAGTAIFTKLASSSEVLRNQFYRLGVDAKQFSALQLNALTNFQRLGMSVKSNDVAMRDYMENLQAVSNLTGKQKEELQKEENERMRQVNYRAALARMGGAQALDVQKKMSVIGGLSPELAKEVAGFIASGGRITKDLQASELRSGGATRRLAMGIRGGTISAEDIPKMIQQISQGIVTKQMQFGETLGAEHMLMGGGTGLFDLAGREPGSLKDIKDKNKAVAQGVGAQNKLNSTLADTSRMIYETGAQLQNVATGADAAAQGLQFLAETVNTLVGKIKGTPGAAAAQSSAITSSGTASTASGTITYDALGNPISSFSPDSLSVDTSKLDAMKQAILAAFPGARITSSLRPMGKNTKSKHPLGRAIDFSMPNLMQADMNEVTSKLRAAGFAEILDERVRPDPKISPDWSGPHIHAAFANGGITSGPSLAGEAGPEAVVPLPDGRTIPVNIGNWDQLVKIWGSIETKLADLVSLSELSNSTQQKQLRYVRN